MTSGRLVSTVFVCAALAPSPLRSDDTEKLILFIIVNRSPLKGDSKEFRVTVNAEERAVAGDPTKVELISRQGLKIEELKQDRSEQSNSVVTHVYNVKLPDKDLNLAELEANLFSISTTGEKRNLSAYVICT